MVLYRDIITGDELFNDSYPIKLVNDLYYEVKGKNIDLPDDTNGINLVVTHKLAEIAFDKVTFLAWLKGYIKNLKDKVAAKDETRFAAFEKSIQKWGTKVLEDFDNWSFYLGEKMDPEGMVVLQEYREERNAPYFIFIKYGLVEEKN